MCFDTAKLVVTILHYAFVWGIMLLFAAWKFRPIRMFYRLYLSVFVWVAVVMFCDGCPLTHLENMVFMQIYGQPMYENYSFEGSDVNFLLQNVDLLIPLIVVTITLICFKFLNISTGR